MSGVLGTLGTALRGLRSRSLLSLASLALIVVAIGGTVVGPMFQQASTISYTVSRLDDAAPPLTGLHWELDPATAPDLDEAVAEASAEVARLSPGAFGPPVAVLTTVRLPREPDGAQVAYVWRDDVCATLEVEGSCPDAAGEVLVNDADRFDLEVGDRVTLPEIGAQEVVGFYRTPTTSDDWLFPAFLGSRPATTTSPYEPGPYVVAEGVIPALSGELWSAFLDNRLDVGSDVTDGQLDRIVSAIEPLRDGVFPLSGGATLLGSSDTNALGSVLDDVRAQRELAGGAVAPAVVSLILVALAMILRLQTAAAELRVPELALASLRGVGRRRSWLLGLVEPWLLVVAGTPLGLLAGYAGTSLLARAWLRPGVPLDVPASAYVAALLVAAAIAAVAAGAVGAVLRSSLGARLTGVRRPGRSARAVVVTELVVVCAAAALPLGKLGTDDSSSLDVSDLLLPVVTAVAAGLLATRATAAAARLWTTRGAERPLSVFVGARALARRSQGTMVILPIAAAVAISVFAVGVDSVASGWRGSVAATRAPGDAVYDSPLTVAQTAALTRRLDPEGRWTMTVAKVAVPGKGQLVLVDASRYERVGHWSPQWLDGVSAADVAGLVGPPVPVPVFEGTELALTGSSSVPGTAVVLEVIAGDDGARHLTLGPFGTSSATLEGTVPECAAGCELRLLTVDAPRAADVVLTGLAVDGTEVPHATDPAGWGSPDAEVTAADDGLEVRTRSGGQVDVSRAGDLRPVPAVAGRLEESLEPVGDGTGVVVTPSTVPVDVVARAESVPLVGPSGVLMDLSTFLAHAQLAEPLVESSVLVRDDAPADVLAALVGQGLTLGTTASDTRAALDDSAYAQALRLYLVVAATILAMALGGLLVSLAVQRPARRRDAASLRVVGVTPRTIVLASWWESVVVLAAALVAGLAAGLLAQAVLLRSLTLGIVDRFTPRVLAEPDTTRVVVLAAAATAVLVGVAVVTSVGVVRRARTATLRESNG